MSSWAQRMHRRAATFGSVVTSCGHPGTPYPHRLEKVKFGVPLEEVCKNDIPGPLLVLILKLNKEAPCRKDVFRAPGNQGAMKKLIHFLQQGRLVNVDNYSVYTIASVLKKFLRKIPGGVFGRDGEAELFQIVDLDDEAQQQEKIHRLLMSLPGHTQRLLVLLFGTFRVIASNSERADTGMTSEALGVSVAPSFFQSCVSDGKTARMKDVLRFKAEVHVATKIMKQMIEQFTACDLFGRVNYEYYARVTGRVLRVQDEWICSFRYPPPPRGKTAQQHYALKLALETEKTWLQCECERWGLIAQEESHSTPALLTTGGPNVGPGIFNVQKSSCSSSSHSSSSNTRSGSQHHMTLDELRAVNRYAESTKSLSYLPQVHERQAARMRTRSEWFLGARGSSLELCHDGPGSLIHPQIVTSTPIPGAIGHGHHHAHGIIGTYDSIEHLYDVDVVNHQDQVNHQHHYHDKQSHHHHHHQHHNPHHPSHRNTHEHAPHHHHQNHITTAVDVQKSAVAHSPRLPRIASNNEHTSTSRNATSNTGPVCFPNERHHPCPTSRGDSTTLSPVQEQLPPHRRQPTCDHRYRDIEKIEPYSDEDNNFDDEDDDDDLTIVPHDELDGDEGDFAISQSHHFDMRAENRRRRRRRALLRRNNSYDRIVASSADGAAKSVGDRAGSSGLAGRRRPESAPAAGEQKKNRPTPTPTTQQPSTSSSHQHAMTNPNTAVTTASTSLSNSSSSNSAPPIPTSSRRSLTAARQHDNSSTLHGGRKAQHHHHHTSRRSSNVSHSISIGNGSTTTLSRQSNLSMIVFSVLDFLF